MHPADHSKPRQTVTIAITLMVFSLLATDLFLPAMPAMANDLHTSDQISQLTIALFLAGLAGGQLFYGPLSDRCGRRLTLCIGMTMAFIGSLICLIAPNITILLLGRIVQGLGAASGVVMMRAICSDLYRGNKLAQISSIVTMLVAFVPGVAPVFGGYLVTFFSWRSNFAALAIIFFIGLLLAACCLKESNISPNRFALRWRYIKASYLHLFNQRSFIGFVLISATPLAGLMAYLTLSPHLLQEVMGISAVFYGWLSVLSGAAMLLGAITTHRLLQHIDYMRLLQTGSWLLLFSGLLLCLGAILHWLSPWAVILPMMVLTFSATLIWSASMAGAMSMLINNKGVGGAIYGSTQLAVAVIVSFVVAWFPIVDQSILAITVLAMGLLAIGLFYGICRYTPHAQ